MDWIDSLPTPEYGRKQVKEHIVKILAEAIQSAEKSRPRAAQRAVAPPVVTPSIARKPSQPPVITSSKDQKEATNTSLESPKLDLSNLSWGS